jgi:tetratricopeptide (TPR) repeat protein
LNTISGIPSVRNAEAARELESIIEQEGRMDPDGKESWFFDFMRLQYGICLAILKRFELAVEQLQAVRDPGQMPKDWTVERQYYLGRCFFELRDFPKASIFLREVAEVDDSELSARALYYLAQAEQKNGRPKAAIKALTRLVKMASAEVPAEYIQKVLSQLDVGGPYPM